MISTSERTAALSHAALRAELALRLAELYGSAVPAHSTRVTVSREVNAAVAADVGGVPSNINHPTARLLDIDALYERTEARGITMIDEIRGPRRPARRHAVRQALGGDRHARGGPERTVRGAAGRVAGCRGPRPADDTTD